VKTALLDVPEDVLATVGAVSEEVAVAMARGARARLGVDIAIATTGIAGPDGGSPEKPVGLMWMALASGADGIETRRLTFPGERADIRMRGTVAALSLVWRSVNGIAAQV
jgi:nicotinamide-nucleotide amidase